MPKTRNKQTEVAIRSAALGLFFEKGFHATTYTDLARRSGVSRSLVQRYFPKKEMLIVECVVAIREASVRACDEAFPEEVSPLVRLYRRGQVNIATYFACDGIRKVMLDMFASRELTGQTITEGFRWSVSQVLGDFYEEAERELPDEMIMAMGGLYEIVYTYLSKGVPLDVPTWTLPSTLMFAQLYDVPLPEAGLETYAIDAEELRALADRAVDLIAWG